ncbi:hypothetical protein Bca101_018803 [Brassica carinata]
MAHRFSRNEKEKWVPSVPPEPKRPPVLIPPTNNENLIAANKLSIIGRVTNPMLQRPRAVVEFLPQIWNLEGRVTGRELGPEKFHLKFESEADLLSVLSKGPYHYKKWMILLQQWEPIVSETFPSTISFWLRIHDLPLHYWNDQALDAIGEELGKVNGKIADEAKVRVEMNGLRPLVMQLEIQLPSGDLTNVELEYFKIEKHCFTCFSLLHEEMDCPSRPRNPIPLKERRLGITQRIALQRIEADKKRHDDRRGYSRQAQVSNPDRRTSDAGREIRAYDQPRLHPYHQQSRRRNHVSSQVDSRYHRNRPSASDRFQKHEHREEFGSRRDLSGGRDDGSHGTPHILSSGRISLGGNTSENGEGPCSQTTPPRTMQERLEFPTEPSSEQTVSDSRGRKSALQRLKDPDTKSSSPRSSSFSKRTATPEKLEPALKIENVTISLPPKGKGTVNRKVSRVSIRRVARSPSIALKPNRTIATKSSNPSRKKQSTDKASSLPCNKAGTSRLPRSNSTRTYQRKRKEGQDFHPPPPPSSLDLMSWNCQGLGSDLTIHRIKEICRDISPDIMFLMETKNDDEFIKNKLQLGQFPNYFSVPPVGLSGGLSLFWKYGVDVSVLESSPNLIDARALSTLPNNARRPFSPPQGTLLCYVDGAWDPVSRNCGTGGFFSATSGHVPGPISDSRRLVSSALMAECLAIRSAVMHAASLNIKSLIILSDSQSLVKLVKERGSVPALFDILFDIYHFSLLFDVISFSYVPRLSNGMADSVAKSALSLLNLASSNGV